MQRKMHTSCHRFHVVTLSAILVEDGTIFHWNLEDGSGVELTPPEDSLSSQFHYLDRLVESMRSLAVDIWQKLFR